MPFLLPNQQRQSTVCDSYTGIFFCYKRCVLIIVADFETMPRGKNKKKFSRRPIYQSVKTAGINPFELKVNRQKHEVLGRKLSKTDKGMPGMSRSKAIKKVCLLCAGYFYYRGYYSAL